MEGGPFSLHTSYVASISRRRSTLGETVIIMSNHLLQNSTDHFAVTRKRKSCTFIVMTDSQIRFGKNPSPQWEKQGLKFPHDAPGLGSASWSANIESGLSPSFLSKTRAQLWASRSWLMDTPQQWTTHILWVTLVLLLNSILEKKAVPNWRGCQFFLKHFPTPSNVITSQLYAHNSKLPGISFMFMYISMKKKISATSIYKLLFPWTLSHVSNLATYLISVEIFPFLTT